MRTTASPIRRMGTSVEMAGGGESSRPELLAVCELQPDEERAGELVDHAAFSSALWNWTSTAHGMPSRTWIRALTTPVPWWGITSPRS